MKRWMCLSVCVVSLVPGLFVVDGCKKVVDVGGEGDAGVAGNGGGGSGGSDGGSGGSGGAIGTVVLDCTKPMPATKTNKVDLLFSIDNSRSMAEKQAILALTVDDLVASLVNPTCVDAAGLAVANQPANGSDACPAGSQRVFAPVTDLHIGIVSSSIGGHGADSCPNSDMSTKECQPGVNTTNNDKGRLLSRLDQCGGTQAPTYDGKGFLAWDPGQVATPPGEKVFDDAMGGGLAPTFRNMVIGVGQIGCGYESQLESIYRFLADPDPYETISAESGVAVPSGTDSVVLAQRKAFLRPDSLLAVVMLTDENDCSTKEYGQFYYVNQLRNGATPVRMPRARQICETDPNDECCKSCGQAQGNCPDDPTCKDPNGGLNPATLSEFDDSINVRCWDQKRRFGIDFLYPTDRYVQAFTNPMITNRQGEVVPNPIFSDLDPSDGNGTIRDAGLVVFTGIVGVPWQDIARDPTDLKKGFKNPVELTASIDATGMTTWDVILGDPATGKKPLDPLMRETYEKRTGVNPITGDALVDATMPLANPINGHERTILPDDLQYACIFPLLPGTERDCTDASLTMCECVEQNNDNPLCSPDPNNGNAPTLQTRAKAYPGLRELAVLEGTCGVVTSICPAQLADAAADDYGYRPVVRNIVERIRPHL